MLNPTIIIFSKIPLAGHTMTRLMPTLTGEECVLLHAALLTDLLLQLKKLCKTRSDVQIALYYASENEVTLMNEFHKGLYSLCKMLNLNQNWIEDLDSFINTHVSFYPQQGRDLGERLLNANTEVLNSSAKAITVGTDCPELCASDFEIAIDALNHKDMAIGASTDGGYYLIGLKKANPSLFKNITWSSSSVYQKSLANAKNQGWQVAELPAYTDIDYVEDILKLIQEKSAQLAATAPLVLQYMQHLYANIESKTAKMLLDVM